MTNNNLTQYLKTIRQALQAGTATEHTHRPALKTLLETLDLRITATNEPKHIACGAPDYVVTRDGLIIGYIKAKDVGKSLSKYDELSPAKPIARGRESDRPGQITLPYRVSSRQGRNNWARCVILNERKKPRLPRGFGLDQVNKAPKIG